MKRIERERELVAQIICVWVITWVILFVDWLRNARLWLQKHTKAQSCRGTTIYNIKIPPHDRNCGESQQRLCYIGWQICTVDWGMNSIPDVRHKCDWLCCLMLSLRFLPLNVLLVILVPNYEVWTSQAEAVDTVLQLFAYAYSRSCIGVDAFDTTFDQTT